MQQGPIETPKPPGARMACHSPGAVYLGDGQCMLQEVVHTMGARRGCLVPALKGASKDSFAFCGAAARSDDPGPVPRPTPHHSDPRLRRATACHRPPNA
jgi:hypothetical protein